MVEPIPVPCRMMPLEMFTPVVHKKVPAGSVIVSPFCA